MSRKVFLLFLHIFFLQHLTSKSEHSPSLVSRISFGSCSNQSAPQPIWDAIIKFDPQVFIWLGDNIYGDNRRPFSIFGRVRTIGPWKNAERFFPSSELEMRYRYQQAKSNPGYSAVRRKARVIGTWDDHDYGLNNAGKEFPGKDINQKLMLDFLDEPQNSPRRKQAGVYASYVFGPQGRQIKIILLDTRYHRDPISSDGSMLGSSQWIWLENELNSSPTEITIIASSIQVISNLTAVGSPLFVLESWARFPKERARLFKLIADSNRSGVFFISGDVHFGEITRYDCGTGYPLYDVTSSGLTQSVEQAIPHSLSLLVRFMAWLMPSTMRIYGEDCRYRSCTYAKPNFGAIEIDWDAAPVSLKIELRDVNGDPVNNVKVLLSDLHPGGTYRTQPTAGTHKHHCSLEVDLPWLSRHCFAIVFYTSLLGLALAMGVLIHITVSVSKQIFVKLKRD
ncbi:uncharacterized protein LOC116244770 isoform X2 [Nymphaea colorata]|uniref:uncharacterized protein LOC116244770 isoform X2 n=1 Tax=Nymphaea colorata TaxID=210225 RepID=UPI00129E291A|nr:uncharacterized protein LOC116244770 isoform X2 [Nymphaea colorata]